MRIPRRSFLITAVPALTFGARVIVSSQTVIERGRFGPDDLPIVRDQLLKLVNSERQRSGLTFLALDDLACEVAGEHALDMVTENFLSHWGSDGRKPYQRYSFAGGIDATQENVSVANNILSVTPYGVARDLSDMHESMYLERPPNDAHRRAILFPQHTHLGFGVALKERSIALVEMYVARYLRIDPIDRRAKRNATLLLIGRLLNAKHVLEGVDVFYEPLPTPPDIAWLRTPRPYSLPEEFIPLRPRTPRGVSYTDGSKGDFQSDAGSFRVPVKLFKNVAGIYTVVFWLSREPTEKPFPAAQICILAE